MDQKPKIAANPVNSNKTGGAYGAGSLTVGGPNIAAAASDTTANNNNPRIDLLHNTGSNLQSPSPAAAPTVAPVAPSVSQVGPAPTPALAPTPAPIPAHRSHKKAIVAIIVVLLLLVGIGGGIWWWMNRSAEEPSTETPKPLALQPITPTKLGILEGGTAVALGGATKGPKLTFSMTLETKANTGSATPEIEIQPLGTPFTGTATQTGQAVSANGRDLILTVDAESLKEGGYHWQARSVVEDQKSEWAALGDGTKADFIVDTTAPTAPVLKTLDGKASAASVTIANSKPIFVGTAEPNAKVAITVGEQTITATADAAGAWQATATTEIGQGSHTPSIVATDTAGNASAAFTLALIVGTASAQPAPPVATPAPVTPVVQPTPPPATPQPQLAATGDSTTLPGAIAALMLLVSIASIALIRSRAQL